MADGNGTLNPFDPALTFIKGHLTDSFLSKHYSHVALRIEWLWGSKECLMYLESVCSYEDSPERPDGRQGFAPEAFYELRELLELHRTNYPEIRTKEPDIWVGVRHRG